MDPFESIGSYAVYTLAGMSESDPLSGALEFFIADSIKVSLLLSSMVFLVSIVRTYVTPQKIRKMLGGRKEGAGNLFAALLGIPTPFCSCSAVPLFIGLVEAGVPLGVTFSFLIASPLINEVALALLLSMFGWQVAALYIGTGLLVAVAAGITIGRLGLESEVEDFVYKVRSKELAESGMGWKGRLSFAKGETVDILRRVGPFLLLGIGAGAFIHGYAPVGLLSEIAGPDNPLAVPVVVLIGIPLYSNAAGTMPVVQALMSKGMAMGTALAFMMSVTALSLPEMIILRKVLKPKLLATLALTLAASFILTGLLFNAVLG